MENMYFSVYLRLSLYIWGDIGVRIRCIISFKGEMMYPEWQRNDNLFFSLVLSIRDSFFSLINCLSFFFFFLSFPVIYVSRFF